MTSLLLIAALAMAQADTAGPDRFPAPPRTEENRAPSPPEDGERLRPRPLAQSSAPDARVTERSRRPDAVLRWNAVALDLIRTEQTTPPQAARHLAMLHVAVYDAVNAIYQTHRPFRSRDRPAEAADPDAAVAGAAHRVLLGLYPRQAIRLNQALEAALAGVPSTREVREGIALGTRVADGVLAWRRADGSARRVPYRGGVQPGDWRPTPPTFAPALLPQWATLAPFGVRDATAYRPGPPPSLGSAEYLRDLDEVRRIGGRDSRERAAGQTVIALFWDDGAGSVTPPGHWNQVAAAVARERGHSLPENARLFALFNLALADSAVACWDCKYHYQFWRPVTVLHDRGVRDWQPLLPTPPFPTYTSGHSTFSGAAAAVLEFYHGTDRVRFSLGSEGWPTARRTFERFSDAAAEAGRSRVYGGIHFEFDNRAGLVTGRRIAEEVCRTHLRPADGEGPRADARGSVSPTR